MTIKEFANKHNLSVNKVKKMRPYLIESTQTPSSKKQGIPEDAKPIYIPDGRKLKKASIAVKRYYYVLDAISLEQTIHPCFVDIPADICRTIIRELHNNDRICLIDGRDENSLNYEDYMLSVYSWEKWNEQASNRIKYILEILKFLNGSVELAKNAIGLVNKFIPA